MNRNRTEEDWFLRGGERPKSGDEQKTPAVTCQNCGGDDLADKPTECLDGDKADARPEHRDYGGGAVTGLPPSGGYGWGCGFVGW